VLILNSTLPRAKIAAHLIIGAREEPFLSSLLESLENVVDSLVVNENSGLETTANLQILQSSSWSRNGTLYLDRTPFMNYSHARNICMAMHAKHGLGDWVAFVDADEVHTPAVKRIAERLNRVPAQINFVDGYTYHFFQSFAWYLSIERRMCFFRFKTGVSWSGDVHEQLVGLEENRIALPYVYAHYGHVFSAKRHAEKGRQYSSLGAAGDIIALDKLDTLNPETYFSEYWPRLLPFAQDHPQAARNTIAQLQAQMAPHFAQNEKIIKSVKRTLIQKLDHFYWSYNYAIRWKSRFVTPLARKIFL
jgi:hypothetical protein